jgi:uncharacterized protein (DUF608 family)
MSPSGIELATAQYLSRLRHHVSSETVAQEAKNKYKCVWNGEEFIVWWEKESVAMKDEISGQFKKKYFEF